MIAVVLVLVGGALGSIWRYSWSGLIADQTLHLMVGRRWPAAFTNVLISTTLFIGLTAAGWELGYLIWLISSRS